MLRPVPLLVLFDVDGTLFLTHDELMGQATLDAIEAIWRRRPAADAIERVDHQGQTATHVTREILRTEGLPEGEIDERLDRWCMEVSSRYLALLVHADTRAWRSPEGTAKSLASIDHRALLTGNPEPVARARMERLGLADLFATGEGAFGCDAEDRPTLIDLARERSGNWAREETVAVGDTPVDVAGAHAAGIRVVAFCSGRCDRARLAEADGLIERMDELPAVLARLSDAP
jgi:phosphoglycolate phosphatase